MKLSPSDLTLMRTQPQQSQLFLSLYQPEVVFQAQLRQTVTGSGDRIIPYANVTTGTSAGILPNFVLMVGTTPGGNDLGAVRVRDNTASGTSNALTVAENSHIQWTSGVYLTALNYVDVEAIYPRIIQTVTGTVSATFYKDFNIPYTNQNTVMGSFVNMGPHRAGFRDPASGQWQEYWSSSGSVNVNGEAMIFQWEFEGGTPTGSTLRDPGYVTYSQPGHYRTRLTITTSGTASDFGYRFVSIYDRPDAGPHAPIVEWELGDLSGTRKQGGYTGRVKIWQRVGPEYVKDGQLVVIFSDDYYGQTRKNLGGNAENCSHIFWTGYVIKGSIQYDYKSGFVEFDIGSITELMKKAQGFSVSCQDDKAPDTWYKIQHLTILRAMYHYLKWHSTVCNLADFTYTGDDRDVQYFDSNRESIYDAIAKFVESGIKGEVVCDRQGKLWVEISPEGTPHATTAFPTCMSLGATDIGTNPPSGAAAEGTHASKMDSGPQISERIFPDIAYVEYGGIVYDHTNGSSIAVLAGGPGATPAYKGDIDHMEGMILTSQSALNDIVGASYAYQNSRFPEISFGIVGAYKNIDIAPLELIYLTIDTDATPRKF